MSRFFDEFKKERIILLNKPIDNNSSEEVVGQLLLFNSINDKPIHLYLSSPGGCVYSGLKIIDMINMINAPVYVFCTGLVASMGVIIAVSGCRGHRYASQHCTFMIHQPSSILDSKFAFSDLNIHLKETGRLKEIIESIMSRNTGRNKYEVERDTDRDFYMNATEALGYGIIDKVIEKNTSKNRINEMHYEQI
jgi:ATP-dependent Clp protease protease subunit